MVRRWVIRGPFLLGLVCVVGVWVGSYFRFADIGNLSWGRYWYLGSSKGSAFVSEYHGAMSILAIDLERLLVQISLLPGQKPKVLGFYVGPMTGSTDATMIIFPLWLPTVLLAGLNWFVWWKTRAKGVGRAFPVEVGRGEGNHDGAKG